MRPAAAETRRLWPEDVPASSSRERLRARIERETRSACGTDAGPCAGCASCDPRIASDNADALEVQRARACSEEDDRNFSFLIEHGLITE